MEKEQNGFEPEEDKEIPKDQLLLDQFKADPKLKGRALGISKDFAVLAHAMQRDMPEGTVKTSLMQRLLDMRDSVVRSVNDHWKGQ